MPNLARCSWKTFRIGLGPVKTTENTGLSSAQARVPEILFVAIPLQFIRHGERSGHWRSASVAQAVVLSVWQLVQGLRILYLSVIEGVMKSNVWALTNTPGIVASIFGM